MSTPTTTTWLYLEPRPKSFYRQLFVKGTRLRAEAVYAWTVDGDDDAEKLTPEQVAAEFNLPLEAVREAILYCQTHPEDIEEDHRREEIVMEATGMNDPDYKLGGKYKILSPQERAQLGI